MQGGAGTGGRRKPNSILGSISRAGRKEAKGKRGVESRERRCVVTEGFTTAGMPLPVNTSLLHLPHSFQWGFHGLSVGLGCSFLLLQASITRAVAHQGPARTPRVKSIVLLGGMIPGMRTGIPRLLMKGIIAQHVIAVQVHPASFGIAFTCCSSRRLKVLSSLCVFDTNTSRRFGQLQDEELQFCALAGCQRLGYSTLLCYCHHVLCSDSDGNDPQ